MSNKKINEDVLSLWQMIRRWRQPLILILSLGVAVSAALLAQAAPETSQNASERSAGRMAAAAATTQSHRGLTEPVSCEVYYFRNNLVDVGHDGSQKVADTTAPFANVPAEASAKLNKDVEIARFYSSPALSESLTIAENITGLLWMQTNMPDVAFNIELFDYNPANGNTVLLGNYSFTLLSAGETNIDFAISPLAGSVPAGHRLLAILHGQKGAPPPDVSLRYDSVDRASQFTVCQPQSGGPPAVHMIYLPIIKTSKQGPTTTLNVESVNTGGIDPIEVFDPGTNQKLLSCTVGNNVTQICGSFLTPGNGTYKIVAHTKACGVLQGTFSDALPGATVLRRILCN